MAHEEPHSGPARAPAFGPAEPTVAGMVRHLPNGPDGPGNYVYSPWAGWVRMWPAEPPKEDGHA